MRYPEKALEYGVTDVIKCFEGTMVLLKYVNQKMAFLGFEMDFFRIFNITLGQNTSFEKLGIWVSVLEPEFGNPSFDTPEKQNVFNFQLTCFSAIFDFILFWLCKPQQ